MTVIDAYAARRTKIVRQVQMEIQEDVREGVLPEGPLTFSDLDTYVDANVYGGLCDDSFHGNADIDAGELVLIQEAVEAWLLSDARNVPKDRPLLDVARRVRARELAPGHWVQRTTPDLLRSDWYLVLRVEWKPARGLYYIQFDLPHRMRNLLADHYWLRPGDSEKVREPLLDDPEEKAGA